MAKHTLGSNDDELDFALIGITSPEDQYTMVTLLDNALQITFRLSDYIPFALKTSRIFHFSLYHYFDEALGLELNLVPNSSNLEQQGNTPQSTDLFAELDVDEKVRLIKELPKTDYFLILKGEDLHNYSYRMVEKIKAIPGVVQVTTIEPADLPSKRNLIF